MFSCIDGYELCKGDHHVTECVCLLSGTWSDSPGDLCCKIECTNTPTLKDMQLVIINIRKYIFYIYIYNIVYLTNIYLKVYVYLKVILINNTTINNNYSEIRLCPNEIIILKLLYKNIVAWL